MFILDTHYGMATELAGQIVDGVVKSGMLVVKNGTNVPRHFYKEEYEIVPPELENESLEIIKLYFAL